jgi:hypothetical protein
MSKLVEQKLWRRSPVYQSKRRIVFLGAFKKWREANPEEYRRVQERFKQQQAAT